MAKGTVKTEELMNNWKKALADYQNLEKRVAAERTEWIRGANKDLILRILPVLDTLTLASLHDKNDSLQISIKQFEDVLKAEEIEKIETEGKDFNPATMECVATIEGENNKVLQETRSGYMLNDKVLRPAQVKVGKESN